MRKRLRILSILLLVLLTAVLINRLRPVADEPVAGTNPAECTTDDQAVVTVIRAGGDSSVASLTSYNQKGSTIVSGEVEVVWRRAFRNPLNGQKNIFGAADGVYGRDAHFGIYSAGQLYSSSGEKGDPAVALGNETDRPKYFLELLGETVDGRSTKPLASLPTADRRDFALGLVAYEQATPSVYSCQTATGEPVQRTSNNLLQAVLDTGVGDILYTDVTVQGSVQPVDSKAHQWLFGDGRFYAPAKTLGQLDIAVESGEKKLPLYNFTNNEGGNYWWLAKVVRPSAEYQVTVNGAPSYSKDWAKVAYQRQEVATSALPNSYAGIDPLAVQALRAANIAMGEGSRITQGLGNADASAGTHGAEPDSPYTASVDIWTGELSTTEGTLPALRDDEIDEMLHALRMVGFAAFYRPTIGDGPHIHAVYAGVCQLKASTNDQVNSFLNGHNGLSGDPVETLKPPTDEEKLSVAKVFSSPYCAQSPRSTVAVQGSGNTLHALTNMDGMQSNYYGHFYTDGYPGPGGSQNVGHFDVSFDRNNIIPADNILMGRSGRAGVSIKNAFPDKITGEGEESIATASGLVAKFGVYLVTGPWQDVYSGGYNSPNYLSAEDGSGYIATFDYDYNQGPEMVDFEYDFSTIDEELRRQGYKWGIAFVRIGDNKMGYNYDNDVIYMPHYSPNSILLPGEVVSFDGYGWTIGRDSNDPSEQNDFFGFGPENSFPSVSIPFSPLNQLTPTISNLPSAEKEDEARLEPAPVVEPEPKVEPESEIEPKPVVEPKLAVEPEAEPEAELESELVVVAPEPVQLVPSPTVAPQIAAAEIIQKVEAEVAQSAGEEHEAEIVEPEPLPLLEQIKLQMLSLNDWAAAWFGSIAQLPIENQSQYISWQISQAQTRTSLWKQQRDSAYALWRQATRVRNNRVVANEWRAQYIQLQREWIGARRVELSLKRQYSTYLRAEKQLTLARVKLEQLNARYSNVKWVPRSVTQQQRRVIRAELAYARSIQTLNRTIGLPQE